MPRLRLVLLALLCSLASTTCGGESTPRWNVILISLDTCRADRLSCYGYERQTSPNLDELAAESVVFDDCLTQSSATAPAHMSLFTGQYVRRHGLEANKHSREPPYTLASILRNRGYQTAGFTGFGSLNRSSGHARGFSTWVEWPKREIRENNLRTRELAEVVPEAQGWLANRTSGQPFFLLVHAYDPHCPFEPPQTFADEYAGWYQGETDFAGLCGMDAFQPLFEENEGRELRGEDKRYLNDLYDAEIRSADVVLGQFLDHLRDRGLFENTLIVFTSDHGEVLGDHGWIGHTKMWEEELHVPLVMRFPGARFAGRRDQPVQHIDVVPTILGFLGIPTPGGMQGTDLMAWVRDTDAPFEQERMRVARVADLKSVRFGTRWKIVFGEDKHGFITEDMLFDLEKDPRELDNLVATPEGQQRFKEIRQRFKAWERSVKEEDKQYRGLKFISGRDEAEHLKHLEALGYTGYAEDEGQ